MLLTRANSARRRWRGLSIVEFAERLVDEPLVRSAIDGLAEQPRGRFHHQVGHLGAQLLDGTVAFAADLRLRTLEERLGVGACLGTHCLSLDGGVAVGAPDDLA